MLLLLTILLPVYILLSHHKLLVGLLDLYYYFSSCKQIPFLKEFIGR